MSLNRVWIPSPNFSSRAGQGVRLIVLHTAEGARTYRDLGAFFKGNVSASSHCGADDTPNTVGEYVRRDDKAWAVAAYNSVSVSLEQCAFAAWSRDEWMKHPELLKNAAKWIAEESAHYGIPIVKLTASEAQGSGRGVCQHRDLGQAGGGHDDCGDGYPIDLVLEMASGHDVNPSPPQPEEEDSLITSGVSDGGTLHVWWVQPDKQTIHYRYQPSGQTAWVDGGVFAKANNDLAGISASRSKTGNLVLFAVDKKGNVYHTWQVPNSTSWSGGKGGQQIAELTPLPGG